jgi:nitrogen regulatory protein PII
MELVIIIINKEEYLDEILTRLVEIGITGVTIVDSIGIGRVLAYDVPIFMGIKQMLSWRRPSSKMIFIVTHTEKVEPMMDAVEDVFGGDLTEPGKGLIFSLPINKIRGLASQVKGMA